LLTTSLSYSFYSTRAHDTDDDEFLDGLEIYKSINHAIQHNADQQSANIEDEFRTGVEDQAAVGNEENLFIRSTIWILFDTENLF